jgi:hypothetical protein
MKSIGILSYLVETNISGKGKDTLLVETGIGGKGKGLLLVEMCYALRLFYSVRSGFTHPRNLACREFLGFRYPPGSLLIFRSHRVSRRT